MMGYQTMPRVFDFAKQDGEWTEVPNPMMAGMPEATTVDGKQVVTYRIAPSAVWSDGEPISSNDFKYTWDQIVNGKDIYDPHGLRRHREHRHHRPEDRGGDVQGDVRVLDPLFSADYGIYPSHILEGKNRHDLMKNGYDWSGGPWTFKWRKGVDVTLSPNPKWYGQKPTIQKVDLPDHHRHRVAVRGVQGRPGRAIYPQSEPSAIASIKGGISGTQSVFSADTGNVEALWMNNAKFPFDSTAVRQAFALLDRP